MLLVRCPLFQKIIFKTRQQQQQLLPELEAKPRSPGKCSLRDRDSRHCQRLLSCPQNMQTHDCRWQMIILSTSPTHTDVDWPAVKPNCYWSTTDVLCFVFVNSSLLHILVSTLVSTMAQYLFTSVKLPHLFSIGATTTCQKLAGMKQGKDWKWRSKP